MDLLKKLSFPYVRHTLVSTALAWTHRCFFAVYFGDCKIVLLATYGIHSSNLVSNAGPAEPGEMALALRAAEGPCKPGWICASYHGTEMGRVGTTLSNDGMNAVYYYGQWSLLWLTPLRSVWHPDCRVVNTSRWPSQHTEELTKGSPPSLHFIASEEISNEKHLPAGGLRCLTGGRQLLCLSLDNGSQSTEYVISRLNLVANNLLFPDTTLSRWILMIILAK